MEELGSMGGTLPEAKCQGSCTPQTLVPQNSYSREAPVRAPAVQPGPLPALIGEVGSEPSWPSGLWAGGRPRARRCVENGLPVSGIDRWEASWRGVAVARGQGPPQSLLPCARASSWPATNAPLRGGWHTLLTLCSRSSLAPSALPGGPAWAHTVPCAAAVCAVRAAVATSAGRQPRRADCQGGAHKRVFI